MKLIKFIIPAISVGAVIAPIATTMSCSMEIKQKHYKILPTYTGQADQLLALGIYPDYYPVQLNQTKEYQYLSNPMKYMSVQKEVYPAFAASFSNKIHSLFSKIGEVGRAWWNLNAEKNDNSNPNSEYWITKSGDLTFYEHYLLDDDKKIIDSHQAPSYNSAIQTNFRWSQDPYTRLSKKTIDEAFDCPATKDRMATKIQKVFGLRDKNGAIASMWNGDVPIIDKSKWDNDSPVFNDAWFAYSWHTGILDNPLLNPGKEAGNFKNFIIDNDNIKPSLNIFNEDDAIDSKLAKMFARSTVTKEQVEAGMTTINYKSTRSYSPSTFTRHHPIYDAQTEAGEAPMFEGARRENMLYLYNLSSKLANKVRGLNAHGKKGTTSQIAEAKVLKNDFAGDPRLPKMENALVNANAIAGNLSTRLDAIKNYLNEIKAAGKVIALTTIAPGGGVSTIQTNSKYSFMFDRIGMKYAMPRDFDRVEKSFKPGKSIFSMDDNGWFWNIGEAKDDLKDAQIHFQNTADIQILTVRDKEWDGMTGPMKNSISSILKGGTISDLVDSRVNYDLWNEGLKTPFVMNMILDDLVKRIEKSVPKINITNAANKFDPINNNLSARKAALTWGTYWQKEFIK